MHKQGKAAAIAAIAVFATQELAGAALTLTPAGNASGYTLTTFASGFPNESNIGPLGIAFTSNGGVMVCDTLGNNRIFPTDTDGQTIAAAPVVATFGDSSLRDFVQDGANIYSDTYTGGTFIQVNQNGTLDRTILTGFTHPLGLAFNPHNNHVILAAAGGIHDIDLAAPNASSFIVSGVAADGISLSADGGTIYGAVNSQILGFNTTTGAQVFSAGVAGGSTANGNYLSAVDGTAIGTGALAGYIFGNTNSGDFVQVSLLTGAQTLIASGGSRGDFVKVDQNNGSLLLTQTSTVLRITGPALVGVHPIISLNPAGTTQYGSQITNGSGVNQGLFTGGSNALTVSGSHGSYTAAQVSRINGGAGLATGYVAVSGFNPGTDIETYGLDVLIGGIPASRAQVDTLIADLTSSHSYGYASTSAAISVSDTDPVPGAFESLSPVVPYNLFITFTPSGAIGDFGFDFSQDPVYGIGGSSGLTATVVAVAVVPEPVALGSLIGAGLLLSRSRLRQSGVCRPRHPHR